MEWIDVEDRLPKEHSISGTWYYKVRGFFELNGRKVNEDVAWTKSNRFVWNGVDVTDNMTHWMPLPEPPE